MLCISNSSYFYFNCSIVSVRKGSCCLFLELANFSLSILAEMDWNCYFSLIVAVCK